MGSMFHPLISFYLVFIVPETKGLQTRNLRTFQSLGGDVEFSRIEGLERSDSMCHHPDVPENRNILQCGNEAYSDAGK